MADITKPQHINLTSCAGSCIASVGGTLKPGKRHIYSKRVFYLDEDSWTALASDQYDARDQLYRSSFAFQSYSYDVQAPFGDTFAIYDFSSACTTSADCSARTTARYMAELPRDSAWSPEALAGAGLRQLGRRRPKPPHGASRGAAPMGWISASIHDRLPIHRLRAWVALGFSFAAHAAAAGFADVLDTPAQISPLASRSLLQAVTRSGDRVVAVGQRGHIVVSVDGGATWKQAPVPVSSDLTAVYFVDDKNGWAVGHDGVILHTNDGGDTWSLQLTGIKANELLVAAMERAVAAEPPSEHAKKLLAEAKRYQDQGPDKPFLDVWFSDAQNGYAVGAYNLIFRTADGGKTWEPWFDRTENAKFFNLYAIRPVGGALFIAGEGGLVLKLDAAAQRFRAVATPYEGSFFGVADAGAPRSCSACAATSTAADGGGTWTKVDAGRRLPWSPRREAQAEPLAGRCRRTRVGEYRRRRTFARLALKQAMPVTGLVDLGGGKLVLVGRAAQQ